MRNDSAESRDGLEHADRVETGRAPHQGEDAASGRFSPRGRANSVDEHLGSRRYRVGSQKGYRGAMARWAGLRRPHPSSVSAVCAWSSRRSRTASSRTSVMRTAIPARSISRNLRGAVAGCPSRGRKSRGELAGGRAGAATAPIPADLAACRAEVADLARDQGWVPARAHQAEACQVARVWAPGRGCLVLAVRSGWCFALHRREELDTRIVSTLVVREGGDGRASVLLAS